MPCRRGLRPLLTRASRAVIHHVPVLILAHFPALLPQLARDALRRRRRVRLPSVGGHVRRRGLRCRRALLLVRLLELVLCHTLLCVVLGFLGAVGIDAAFGEVVGAAAGYDEGAPAVAMIRLV